MTILALTAIVVLAIFASGWLIGRAMGLEEGYDVGRASRLEHELAAADALRAVSDPEPIPDFVDCVARRWV